MQYVARKPLTLSGRRYGAGEVVPMDEVLPKARKQLIEQRRVLPQAAKKNTRKKKRS
jgi:hypothetical protein